jgi:hypothetical protein
MSPPLQSGFGIGFSIARALLAIGLCAKAGATTIVAIWSPTKIVITGDSLLNINWTGKGGVRLHRYSNVCKIRKFGSNYISAAGNYHIQIAGFDVWDTAERTCGASASVSECTVRFKEELRKQLTRTVAVHEIYLSVLVAGLQNGVPALDHVTFIGKKQERVTMTSESFREGRQTWGRVILGDRDAIDQYERDAASTMSGSIQEQALSLVRVEARARPQEVGAPFSTLAIVAAGAHWVNPGYCSSASSSR